MSVCVCVRERMRHKETYANGVDKKVTVARNMDAVVQRLRTAPVKALALSSSRRIPMWPCSTACDRDSGSEVSGTAQEVKKAESKTAAGKGRWREMRTELKEQQERNRQLSKQERGTTKERRARAKQQAESERQDTHSTHSSSKKREAATLCSAVSPSRRFWFGCALAASSSCTRS